MRAFTLFLLFLLAQISYGQSKWTPGATVYYGAMFKYLKSQPWLNFTGLHGVELKAIKHTRGERAWEAHHGFPKLKVAASYFNYGVPKAFGEFYTGVVGLNYSILGSKNFKWAPGFGLGYSTRYNTENNPVNKAVSTKISFVAELDFLYEWRFSDKATGDFSLAFRHASNGNIKKPNYGMNFVVAGVSVDFDHKTNDTEFTRHPSHSDLRKFRYYLIYTTGWKDARITRDSELYKVQNISFFAAYRFSNINSFVAGLDGFYDTSQYEEFINQTKNTPPFDENDFDKRQLAFSFGNIFHFGRLGIISQAGLFLYRPYDFMKFSYQRYGFQYTVAKHIVLHSALKAYFGSADLVEFGAGIRL